MDKFCCRRYNSLYLMFNKEKVRQQCRSKNGMTMAYRVYRQHLSHKFMWELHWAVMY